MHTRNTQEIFIQLILLSGALIPGVVYVLYICWKFDITNEPAPDKTNKMACVPSED